jgi:hypothetical protein
MNKSVENVFRGAILRCDVCGWKRDLPVEQSAYYMRYGWPKHCGQQARMVTKHEQEDDVNEQHG